MCIRDRLHCLKVTDQNWINQVNLIPAVGNTIRPHWSVVVSMLSRYVVSPREGHLQQVFHLFAYLKHHKHSKMVFDDTEPVFDESSFCVCDWLEYYPDVEEAIPHNMPEPLGNGVVTSTFVDADSKL